VFGPSLGWVWMSRSKVKGEGHQWQNQQNCLMNIHAKIIYFIPDVVPCWNKIILGRSTDGGGWGLKFFKIILFNTEPRLKIRDFTSCRQLEHCRFTAAGVLPVTLVDQVERLVRCLCTWTITFELNDLWPIDIWHAHGLPWQCHRSKFTYTMLLFRYECAYKYILNRQRAAPNVRVAKVFGATASEGFF